MKGLYVYHNNRYLFYIVDQQTLFVIFGLRAYIYIYIMTHKSKIKLNEKS